MGLFLCAVVSAQDSQSLGDIARQARLKKQQKEAQAKASAGAQDSDEHRVVTNEEIPARPPAATPANHSSSSEPGAASNGADHDAQAERWKSQIQNQKSAVAALQDDIAALGSSIHYTGANCVANCTQWNERQQQKQQQLERMKAKAEEEQKRLEEMQNEARKQGFGSAVYDP